MEKHFISENSWYDISFLPEDYLNDFAEIWKLCPETRQTVNVFGEKVIPRFQQSYLRDYTFSGTNSVSKDLPPFLEKYLNLINSQGYGEFNQVLMNYYPNGHSYIGSHADDEKQLIPNSPIVTISLGAERNFRIRDKKTKKIVKDIVTKKRNDFCNGW